MLIPKYIDKLLDRRAKLAQDLNDVDYKISQFIMKHQIEVDEADYMTGYEIYANPYPSVERVKEAINKHVCK